MRVSIAQALFFATGAVYVTGSAAQTWCGKNYMASSPIIPPGGAFPVPVTSASPLLALRCAPAIRPYLPEDATAPSSLLINAIVTFSHIAGAVPIDLPHTFGPGDALSVTASIDGTPLAHGTIPLNATKAELPFSLASLRPRPAPYNVTCTATFYGQTFTTTTALSYVPDPVVGSVTKMDLRTGALLARPADGDGKSGAFAPVFPIGFYTSFGGYLADNITILDELKEQGFTIVHPIPTFDNETALEQVLDRMHELGLYLMYDMRNTYMNTTSVTAQVNSVKTRPNLLLWYTADEPDGPGDPLTATSTARDLINTLDGGNHPVSLVLNCLDYFWSDYATGADIVLQDTYMVGNNVTFSSQWGTPCTLDYGCCGCDDCLGDFEDISQRMDTYTSRMRAVGWELEKAVWTVPQAFGNETYWPRYPTGKEYLVQSILGINHGALGVVAWDDPTTPDIKAAASLLAKTLPAITPFIFSHAVSFAHVFLGRVDAGLWTVGAQTLVLATNLNYADAALTFADLQIPRTARVRQVLDSGARRAGSALAFDAVGTGAFIFTTTEFETELLPEALAAATPSVRLVTQCRPRAPPTWSAELWQKWSGWVEGLALALAAMVWFCVLT